MKLFSGSASITLGAQIAKDADIPSFAVDQHVFPDGERRIRINENVVDSHVVVVQSANPPVDANYMELFFLLDALKRSGAEFITAVIPYFGYQRQDHIFRDGEAVSLEVVIRLLENLGIDKLISVDMHSVKIPSLFHVPVRHISALPLFAQKIQQMDTKETILVSPDMGGIARIKELSEMLDNMPYIALEKNRDLETGNITIDAVMEGAVQNAKRAILVDDMISSGHTVILGSEFLKKKGIEEVYAFATHPIFSEDAPDLLQKSAFTKVYVTDTVAVPKEKQFKKLEVLSVAPLIAQALKA